MSQAAQNIVASATADKADTTMGAAMTAARKTSGKKAHPAKASQAQAPARRDMGARQVITFASAGMLAPTHDMMTKLYRLFSLDPVDVDDIVANTRQTLQQQAEALRSSLSDKAMEMHFQRVVGAYVGSAYGAAQFFDGKRAIAKDMASKLNDQRDEDRDGPSGFESRVERAQGFAAEMARQSYALLAAAEGAVAAYAEITGNDWKPYVSSTPEGQAVSRQAAAARASAFD
ncbi:hypothetical protein [Roseomonas gilardii]|uniref:hypothetical protein n=1 Tax=Roseomonas gilardii TaxID=257708 RepID=UPI00119FEFA2|nr:hypothetical protein [Roseomonas gilardii]